MRILIGCEESAVCREAFAAKGHDVWSCDTLPSAIPGKHYQCDIMDILYTEKFDMLVAFPPCTHLAVSGSKHFHKKAKVQAEALEFVRKLMEAPIDKIAIENPIGVISTKIRKPDQIVSPHFLEMLIKKVHVYG